MSHFRDIFEALADVDLLTKIAHGKTQNSNECVNSTIWNILSKNGFGNRELVELVVNMAVCLYNEGQLPILDVLNSLGVPVGENMIANCVSTDKLRVSKKRRAEVQAVSKRKKSERRESEEDDYVPGLGDF